MILCSVEKCRQPPGSGLIAKAREQAANSLNAMIQFTQSQLANFVKKLKNWWIGLTDYLKASASDTWQNVDEMFAEFDKEGYVIPASDFDAGTKKECASLLLLLCDIYSSTDASFSGFSAGMCKSLRSQTTPISALTKQGKFFLSTSKHKQNGKSGAQRLWKNAEDWRDK